jgi:energy-coupling factor transport system permease protein
MAVAASRTRNPVLLALILAVTGFVVSARRSDAPWAHSFTAFLKLGLLVIGVRVVLQALLSTRSQGNTVLFTLPLIPLPAWAAGVKLGGEVTAEALLTALYDGFQLAVMLCCVGAANALASPRRLLKSLPGALYEMGVACVVALTFAPQLVTDGRRVRAARRLRGRTHASFRTTAMPVLEGALDRSVELAAAMDSRGYGRTAQAPKVHRRLTALCVLLGLLGILLGVYALLTDSMAFPFAAGALAARRCRTWTSGTFDSPAPSPNRSPDSLVRRCRTSRGWSFPGCSFPGCSFLGCRTAGRTGEPVRCCGTAASRRSRPWVSSSGRSRPWWQQVPTSSIGG